MFGREGDNLTITVPVTFPEAALGADIEVPTLDGPAGDRADPGRHPQRPDGFRVRGRGVATGRDGAKGDLLVTVEVAVPQRAVGDGAARAGRSTLAAARATTPRDDSDAGRCACGMSRRRAR